MPTTTQPPKPKRRWYQFSLKTLLIVMTVAIVAFGGWVQYRRYRAQKNRDREAAVQEAVAAIEKLGGKVTSKYNKRRSQTWLEKQFDDPGGVDDPVGVLKVRRVDLVDTETTDADLSYLEGLTHLRRLNLWGTKVTDAGLGRLKGLKSLRHLCLWGTNITDAGLENLQGLTSLKELWLINTDVTHEGVEKLQQALPKCKVTNEWSAQR